MDLTGAFTMQIGYGRISTKDQKIDQQKNALEGAGCEKTFFDVACGVKALRPELRKCKEHLRKGDTLTVWRLDRLGCSVKQLVDLIQWFEVEGVVFKSLQENIDTSRPTGKLVFHVFASLAECERNLMQERTDALGRLPARARVIVGGRQKSLDEVKATALKRLYDADEHSVDQLCELFDISESALYGYVRN